MKQPAKLVVHDASGQLVTACPHCGGKSFFVEVSVSGRTICKWDLSGTPQDNTHVLDAINVDMHKVAFCCGCNKKLGTTQ